MRWARGAAAQAHLHRRGGVPAACALGAQPGRAAQAAGGHLGSLRELEVWGAQEQLLSAVGAVATAAPSLVRLEIVLTCPLPCVEVSPICSASLESIRVGWQIDRRLEPPPPQVLLTFLPGCTRLQDVVVHFTGPAH